MPTAISGLDYSTGTVPPWKVNRFGLFMWKRPTVTGIFSKLNPLRDERKPQSNLV